MLSFNVKCAILILAELDFAGQVGKGLKPDELRRKLGYPKGLQKLLTIMKGAGFIEQDAYRGWYSLKIDIATLNLLTLVSSVDPWESYCGEWPSNAKNYPYLVGFITDMEECMKTKTIDTIVSTLIYKDQQISK